MSFLNNLDKHIQQIKRAEGNLMKILIIGELNEESISSNTMELITKAKDLSSDIFVATIGSIDKPDANVNDATSTYIKINENVLSTHQIANELKKIIDENSIEAIFATTSYLGRDLAAFLSVDYDSPSVSNVIDVSTENGFVVKTAINGGKEYILNGGNSTLLEIKEKETVTIKSNCLWLRPVVFSYKNKFIDVHHS